MTTTEKKILLQFIIRTEMYIPVMDKNNIVSFIHGFEIGTNKNCDFTKLVQKYLEEELAIPYSSDGWSGQIKRYSLKKNITWTIAFRKIGLEVLASEQNGVLNIEMQEIIKSRIINLINKINENGDYYFGKKSWIDDWNSICITKSEWFKKIWQENEFNVIKSIGREIKRNNLFEDFRLIRPTEKLLNLKNRFNNLHDKN